MSDFSSADWSRAKVVQSTDQRNDVMVAQYVFSFSCARFPEKTRRKWTLKTVNVIVKKQTKKQTNRQHFSMVCTLIDHRNDDKKCSKLCSGTISMFDKSTDHGKLLLNMKICKRKLRKADP